MKTKAMITMLVSVAMILTAPIVAMGKGKPTDPGGGGGSAGDAAGALYGDLYVIERDGAGVPIPRNVTYSYVDPETSQTVTVTVTCLQPLADTCKKLPFWGECGQTLPDDTIPLPSCTFDPELYDPCAVYSTESDFSYVNKLQTVSFGRESVGRSPPIVLDSSYAEALKAINLAAKECGTTPGAGPAIKLDPAGRIMLCIPQEDTGDYAWKTIDAPLENLGMYRAVMTDNCFSLITQTVVGEGGVTEPYDVFLSSSAESFLQEAGLGHLVCGDTLQPQTKEDMLSAAVFIGAAADKTSPKTLDEIINMNTYLGVNTYTYIRDKQDRTLTVEYFPFTVDGGPGGWFSYKRGVDACKSPTQATLLTGNSPTYTVATFNVFGGPPNGVDLRGANGVAITVCREGLPLAEVCDNPDSNTVYGPGPNDIGCGGANWFAQAAEDARKTIWYLHNWRLPVVAY